MFSHCLQTGHLLWPLDYLCGLFLQLCWLLEMDFFSLIEPAGEEKPTTLFVMRFILYVSFCENATVQFCVSLGV